VPVAAAIAAISAEAVTELRAVGGGVRARFCLAAENALRFAFVAAMIFTLLFALPTALNPVGHHCILTRSAQARE